MDKFLESWTLHTWSNFEGNFWSNYWRSTGNLVDTDKKREALENKGKNFWKKNSGKINGFKEIAEQITWGASHLLEESIEESFQEFLQKSGIAEGISRWILGEIFRKNFLGFLQECLIRFLLWNCISPKIPLGASLGIPIPGIPLMISAGILVFASGIFPSIAHGSLAIIPGELPAGIVWWIPARLSSRFNQKYLYKS